MLIVADVSNVLEVIGQFIHLQDGSSFLDGS
jgi:hypothetical protein